MPIYAIGDIHGQRAMLEDMLARIDRDGGRDARVVFLGDYVDRGPDSKGVVQVFLDGLAAGRDWHFVKGNHDSMFERFVEDGTADDAQIRSGKYYLHPNLGGQATLASYLDVAGRFDLTEARLRDNDMARIPDALMAEIMAATRDAMPEAHRAFFRGLKLSHEEAGKIFVHAGLRPGLPLRLQSEDDLLWIRDEFLRHKGDFGGFVVHGHTPVDAPDLRINRLNLDTGAGYGQPLTGAVFDAGAVFMLGPSGRIRLGAA